MSQKRCDDYITAWKEWRQLREEEKKRHPLSPDVEHHIAGCQSCRATVSQVVLGLSGPQPLSDEILNFYGTETTEGRAEALSRHPQAARYLASDRDRFAAYRFSTDILQRGLEKKDISERLKTIAAEIPMRRRLTTALNRLASMRKDLQERLTAWLKQLERGAVHAEATMRAVLMGEQAGTVEVMLAMSHPSLQAAYAGMGIRGERGETVGESQAASAVVITTHSVPSARVAVEGDAVVVAFVDWGALSPPLVVLVPDDERSAPRTPDRLDNKNSKWTARFEHVPAGTYLLAVAPVGE